MNSCINIRGARTHNLKNISLSIPKNQLVVVTGLSGSGKSSLAFDTIYAEGQRRYVESLSSYARQFLGVMEKPDVDSIEGLSPAVSIEQKTTTHNPRSTVGTITEVYDYLRVLFARIGIPHCPNDGEVISATSVDQIIESILHFPLGTRLEILSPVVRDKKGSYAKELEQYLKKGFINAYIDEEKYSLEEEQVVLHKNKKHSISLIVDRFTLKDQSPEMRSRLADSLELAIQESQGLVLIKTLDQQKMFSTHYACPICGYVLPELHPRLFSFNLPEGACEECSGLGFTLTPQEELILDMDEPLMGKGIKLVADSEASLWYHAYMEALSKRYKFSLDIPIKKLSRKIIDIVLYGTGEEKIDVTVTGKKSGASLDFSKPYEGLVHMVERRFHESKSETSRQFFGRFMHRETCQHCHGFRLKPNLQCITIQKQSIGNLTSLSIKEAFRWLQDLELTKAEKTIADKVMQEVNSRLSFLIDTGLGYLTLHRNADTLSGGEMQRIRLATQVGTKLTGVIYVLDEPSIGLHQRDNDKLIKTLIELKSLGNTLIIVEHDEQIIRTADFIVDMGLRAGILGGEVLTAGTLKDVLNHPTSLTTQYLTGKKKILVPQKHRAGNGKKITLKGVSTHNLKNINVSFPLGKFIAVTGVSGSGKSSLIQETLLPACQKKLGLKEDSPSAQYKAITGVEYIESLINIDQSPIGRTPRSNPGTYVKIFDQIREIFAQTKAAKLRGFLAGRFSFNVKGGRCESCSGDGVKKIEMHFLADVYVECEVCGGKRYNQETLEVQYRDKNIYDVLSMTVMEAYEFFQNHSSIRRILQTLMDVGLDYITLGQNSTTLSGGEAQRIKLSRELAKRTTGNTFYILDEPTTGLHFDDVSKLIAILNQLVDTGNTVLVVEHNLDMIKVADHIIDIGPEGGAEGGSVLAEGTPREIVKKTSSYTGQYLKDYL